MSDQTSSSVGHILDRVHSACRACGRDPGEVVVIGASKRQPLERLVAAHRAGVRVFGENRVQEAEQKRDALPSTIEWHLIGPLQSNKTKKAVELFSTIHSVDRHKIARRLSREAELRGVELDVFLQFNLADEASKSGYAPRELDSCLELFELTALRIRGLMAIPPATSRPELARPWFTRLRGLRDQLALLCAQRGFAFDGGLSMGMSQDFEVAIEEGATHVRIGTALFGPRPD